ncbi:DUF397 domain-containing protein [Streptomyces sp. NPDC029704]|uniref:DUF397 domain-containing protein n=1 Tax=Streptomyces TaxID=1883 RepID=UPI00340C1D51
MPVLTWLKSSFSSGGPDDECIELAASAGTVHLRQSDAPSTVLTVTPAALRTLLTHTRAGGLHRPA